MGSYGHRLSTLDVLALTAALWFLAKLLRYAFPPLFEPLQGTYGVSNAVLGLAFTGLMLCYAAMQFPAGVLADRIGPVRVIAGGALAASVVAMTLIIDATFGLLVLTMLAIGVGTGLHKTVSVTLLARVYPTRTGRALGIHDTVGALAGVVAPIAAIGFVGSVLGWRSLFVLVGLIGLVTAVAFVMRVPSRLTNSHLADRDPGPAIGVDRYVALFADRRLVLFVVLTILFSFTYNGVIAFLPLYLMDVAGLSIGLAGLLYSLLFAVTVVQLVTGELSDRLGRIHIVAVCLALGFGGLTLLLVLSHPISLGFAVAAFGIGGHGYRPARDAYLSSIIPTAFAGGGIGMVRTLLMGSGAIAPAAVGILSDVLGFRAAFGMLCVSIGLATVCALLLLSVHLADRTDAQVPRVRTR